MVAGKPSISRARGTEVWLDPALLTRSAPPAWGAPSGAPLRPRCMGRPAQCHAIRAIRYREPASSHGCSWAEVVRPPVLTDVGEPCRRWTGETLFCAARLDIRAAADDIHRGSNDRGHSDVNSRHFGWLRGGSFARGREIRDPTRKPRSPTVPKVATLGIEELLSESQQRSKIPLASSLKISHCSNFVIEISNTCSDTTFFFLLIGPVFMR